MVGGGVGGNAIEGSTEHPVFENVTSSTAMSPETLFPRIPSNTIYKQTINKKHLSRAWRVFERSLTSLSFRQTQRQLKNLRLL